MSHARLICLLLLVALVPAGCKSTQPASHSSAPQTAAPQAAPASALNDGTRLTEFDIVKGTNGQLIGTYRRNADGTWSGPEPTNGEPRQWGANVTAASVVLYTDGPPIRTIVVYPGTDEVSSSGLDRADQPLVARSVYQ